MNRFVFPLVACAVLVMSLVSSSTARMSSAATTFNVDPIHSAVVFRVMHMDAGPFWGRFNAPTGSIVFNGDDLSLDVTIEIKKIDTANKGRDEHLRGPDFFNEPEFPKATFKSKSAKKTGENTWDVTGDLTIRGKTVTVTLPMTKTGESKNEDPRAGHRAGVEGEITIKRSEFGIGQAGGLGDDVKMIVALEGKV